MPRLLDYTIHEAVQADGLPRVADYDDDSRHVLYLNGGSVVQSLTAAEWLATRGPLPVDPTPGESAAAIAAREAALAAALAAAATKRAQILAIAQSTVGIRADLLTNLQLRALFGIILWEAGALDGGLLVRPLAEWVRPLAAPPQE